MRRLKFYDEYFITKTNPAPVWIYFEEICRIPRLSKNEVLIRKYLLDFAARHRLESKEDYAGNVLITKPSSPGYENRRTIVLQSHMDMVEKRTLIIPTIG
jgi:dipeptidase D